jgi:glycosyltransferase involved in cell wall biosynthesis
MSSDSTTPPPLVAAIPAYNQDLAVASVVLQARKHVREVVVVDDGSTDRTAHVAELAGARVVRHAKNGGYGAALRTIFQLAKDEGWPNLIILDSDGQHDPRDIPLIAAPVLAGRADICIGSRFLEATGREGVPRYRQAGIRVLTALNNLGASTSQSVTDGQSGYRCFSQKAVSSISPRDSDMGISAEILFQARAAKLSMAEVPTKVRYDVPVASSKNPVLHGLGVAWSMAKFALRTSVGRRFALLALILLVAVAWVVMRGGLR